MLSLPHKRENSFCLIFEALTDLTVGVLPLLQQFPRARPWNIPLESRPSLSVQTYLWDLFQFPKGQVWKINWLGRFFRWHVLILLRRGGTGSTGKGQEHFWDLKLLATALQLRRQKVSNQARSTLGPPGPTAVHNERAMNILTTYFELLDRSSGWAGQTSLPRGPQLPGAGGKVLPYRSSHCSRPLHPQLATRPASLHRTDLLAVFPPLLSLQPS